MTEQLRLVAALIGYAATIGGVFAFLGKIWRSIKAEKDGVLCLLRSNIRAIYYRPCDAERPALREYERQDLDDLYEKMRGWKVVT